MVNVLLNSELLNSKSTQATIYTEQHFSELIESNRSEVERKSYSLRAFILHPPLTSSYLSLVFAPPSPQSTVQHTP